MKISFLIITHNRREVLAATLTQLRREAMVRAGGSERGGGEAEIVVVDNASTDGTAEMAERDFPEVRLLRRPSNEGSLARNVGAAAARGEYLVLLDDDSHPLGDTAARSAAFLDAHPRAALVGGRVLLPDGSEDAAALPIIMPACALCLRRSAFLAIGGFSADFFRQAEEYDLVFRLLGAGWSVHRFEDLEYAHHKVAVSRNAALIHRLDLRNNLLLLHRYLPRPLRREYRRDWVQRYVALARAAGLLDASREAIREARQRIRGGDGEDRTSNIEHRTSNVAQRRHPQPASAPRSMLNVECSMFDVGSSSAPSPLPPHLIETIFGLDAQARAVADWARRLAIRRVVLVDLGKNLYATWRAARLAHLDVLAVSETSPAFIGLEYRGIPVLPQADALALRPEGVILAELNPARIARREAALRQAFAGPVLRLWQPRYLDCIADTAGSAETSVSHR